MEQKLARRHDATSRRISEDDRSQLIDVAAVVGTTPPLLETNEPFEEPDVSPKRHIQERSQQMK